MKTTLNFLLLILYVLLIISCEDKDDKKMKLENAEIQLVSGSTAQIIVTPSILGCEFESKQPLIASVSTEGVVKGVKIGKTVVSVINNTNGFSENCYVTISPMYKMYNEPFMGFGKPKSHVMSFENRKLLSETTDGLLYEGENYSIFAVLYLFENLKLQSSVVLLEYSVTNPKELVSFLAERYILNEGEGDIAIIFFSIDRKVAGGVTVMEIQGSYYYTVMYFEYPSSINKSDMIDDDIIFKSIREKVKMYGHNLSKNL